LPRCAHRLTKALISPALSRVTITAVSPIVVAT
jgi:hypothetical protein